MPARRNYHALRSCTLSINVPWLHHLNHALCLPRIHCFNHALLQSDDPWLCYFKCDIVPLSLCLLLVVGLPNGIRILILQWQGLGKNLWSVTKGPTLRNLNYSHMHTCTHAHILRLQTRSRAPVDCFCTENLGFASFQVMSY
eukprot:scaffold28774_cov15-Tisochrysis_lutea.AAC.1